MNFRERVFHIVKQIPPGRVASYGQVATLAGNHRAARQVGWALNTCPSDGSVPWWRVVNREGYLSIRNEDVQAKLEQKMHLEREGVNVDSRLFVEMKTYAWNPGKLFDNN